jgi:hypothetical protein
VRGGGQGGLTHRGQVCKQHSFADNRAIPFRFFATAGWAHPARMSWPGGRIELVHALLWQDKRHVTPPGSCAEKRRRVARSDLGYQTYDLTLLACCLGVRHDATYPLIVLSFSLPAHSSNQIWMQVQISSKARTQICIAGPLVLYTICTVGLRVIVLVCATTPRTHHAQFSRFPLYTIMLPK